MSGSETSEVQELQDKDVIIDRVRKLFGDDVAQKFQDEEITHFSAIADLLKREADANIFRNLGLKYGSAVRFKTEFSNTGPVRELCSTPRLKPTMGEMSGFNPEMKRLYLSKRKKVGLVATQKWGAGNFPKFNTPEMKTQLKTFASDIEAECSIPEIGFTSDAICQHIQDYFNEQRRYSKRNGQQDGQVSEAESLKSGSSKSEAESAKPADKCSKPVRQHVKRKTSAISGSFGKKFRATLDKTPPEQDNTAKNLSDSGESLSTLSPYESSDSSESPRTPTGASSPSEIKAPSTLTSSQVVIKAVFGKLLTRQESVDILKSRFLVKQNTLTNLTPRQVMSVLVKKLVRHNYVTLKENVSSLCDCVMLLFIKRFPFKKTVYFLLTRDGNSDIYILKLMFCGKLKQFIGNLVNLIPTELKCYF